MAEEGTKEVVGAVAATGKMDSMLQQGEVEKGVDALHHMVEEITLSVVRLEEVGGARTMGDEEARFLGQARARASHMTAGTSNTSRRSKCMRWT